MRSSFRAFGRRSLLPWAASLVSIGAFVIIAAAPARAQNFSDRSKWELGGHYALLTLPTQCTGSATCESADSGLGANLTYNFSTWVSLDTEMDFFADNGDPATPSTGGNVTEGLFGVRFGPTTRHWGLYSEFRPGFVNFSRVLGSVGAPPGGAAGSAPGQFSAVLHYQADSPSPIALLGFTRATDFALNYGEVIEYRVTKHAALRFDIGDTIVSYPGSTLATPFHQHNFQISEAFIIRF